MEAVINMVISAFAIQRTWTYIRDPKNDKDLWWYMNAFIMALAVFSIFVNISSIRKAPVAPPPVAPIQAVPVVQVVPYAAPPAFPPPSLGDQARSATQKAVALTQQAHLQAP
jgi:hypothetical protein